MEDSYYLATGRQLWDASSIRSATLIIASERDFWSRPEDRRLLEMHVVHEPRVEVVVIPNATHYVHLDRPERGRTRFFDAVLDFLAGKTTIGSAGQPPQPTSDNIALPLRRLLALSL